MLTCSGEVGTEARALPRVLGGLFVGTACPRSRVLNCWRLFRTEMIQIGDTFWGSL